MLSGSINRRAVCCAALAAPTAFLSAHVHAGFDDPFADTVVDYQPGIGATPGFLNPLTALGSPERFTGEGSFPSAVTPFNSPFGTDEIVSIGEGGLLILAFDTPVTDDPANPFGIDLLVFGNAFFFDADFPNGVAGGLASEGGLIEVSADGIIWFPINNVQADGLYPTLGYLDLDSPFTDIPGDVPSDFTLPVDPSFDPTGLAFADIVAGYNGSGGGAGVDISGTDLDAISFVRISNPVGSGFTPEIDAISDVSPIPAPAGVALALGAGAVAARRRRR